MKHRSWNKVKRWFLWLGGCAVVLVLAGRGFMYWINITPQVKIPTPIMPNPNGYDFFLRAGKAYVDNRKGVDESLDVHWVPGKKYPIAPKEAWLHQNAKALRLLREGFKYPVLHPPVRHFDVPTEYGQFRSLTRLLIVESHVRAERGDLPGASDSMLDGLEFGFDIPRGGPLTAGLFGIAMQAISLKELYNLLPHLDAATSRRGASRMEHLYEGRFPYFKTMQEEEWSGQSASLELMNGGSWRNGDSWRAMCMRIINSPLDDPYHGLSRLKNNLFLVTSKRTLLNNYTEALDAQIANGRLPYAKMRHMPASKTPLITVLLPELGRFRWNWGRVETWNVQIMTMFALRAFRLNKGHYPTSLIQLVPQYLKKVPIDPFIGDAPLHYKLQGQKYLLWSIGPDGVDNHGAPIINNGAQGNARYLFDSPDSKGDVVAEINMP